MASNVGQLLSFARGSTGSTRSGGLTADWEQPGALGRWSAHRCFGASESDISKCADAVKKLVTQHVVIAIREDQLFTLASAQRAMGGRHAMFSPARSFQGLEYNGGATALRARPTKILSDGTLHCAHRGLDRIEDRRGHLRADFRAHGLLTYCLDICGQ